MGECNILCDFDAQYPTLSTTQDDQVRTLAGLLLSIKAIWISINKSDQLYSKRRTINKDSFISKYNFEYEMWFV